MSMRIASCRHLVTLAAFSVPGLYFAAMQILLCSVQWLRSPEMEFEASRSRLRTERMKRVVGISLMVAGLLPAVQASAQPLPGDSIKDAADAIEIGKETCTPEATSYLQSAWHAEFRDGLWLVWFEIPGTSNGPTFAVHVRADDGVASLCTVQVKTRWRTRDLRYVRPLPAPPQ